MIVLLFSGIYRILKVELKSNFRKTVNIYRVLFWSITKQGGRCWRDSKWIKQAGIEYNNIVLAIIFFKEIFLWPLIPSPLPLSLSSSVCVLIPQAYEPKSYGRLTSGTTELENIFIPLKNLSATTSHAVLRSGFPYLSICCKSFLCNPWRHSEEWLPRVVQVIRSL